MRNNLHQAIQFGHGFGPVKFGSTKPEVERTLGLPDEKELFDETELAEDWYYKLLKLHVGFYADPQGKDLRVVSFLTGSQSATLWGTRVVGLQKPEILKLPQEQSTWALPMGL